MRKTIVTAVVVVGALSVLAAAPSARAAAPLPPVASSPGDPLTPAERDAVVSWTMAQPRVRELFGTSRTRVLRAGADMIKTEAGERRRALLTVRDYERGIAQEIAVDLVSGAISTRPLPGLVQPSEEEVAEARSIVLADAALAPLAADPELTLMGGFFTRSAHADDPCAREICVEMSFMRPSFEPPPVRRIIVNLTRLAIANRDFRSSTDPAQQPRLSAPEEGR